MRTQEIEELFVEPPPRFGARRFVLAFFAICAVGSITALAILARNRDDAVAQLRIRDAGVTVLHPATPERTGSEGQDLGEGDVVRTDATGRAQIDLFDGSVVRLDNGSEVSLNQLSETPDGRDVALGLLRGRIWNRVADQEDGDSYAVDLGEAVVTAVGTTFLTDCTTDPVCYVLGVEGEAVVESSVGREVQVGPKDCVEVDANGRLDPCDPDDLIDAWVRENLAEDQQLTFASGTPSPTPSPSPTSPVRRAPAAPAAPAATPAPTPAPTAEPTPDPDTPMPDPRPSKPPRTPKPEPTPETTPDESTDPVPTISDST